jgi:hypothetical protein
MHRLAAGLLCALATVAAAVAPAPRPQPWVAGWDRPVDLVGNCRFDRNADKLTITIPGKDHGLDVPNKRLNAPYLLRDVRGDFSVQVRVGAVGKPTGRTGYHRAGLLLTDGWVFWRWERSAHKHPEEKARNLWFGIHWRGEKGSATGHDDGPPLNQPAYLRIERRGEQVLLASSEDGKTWLTVTRASWLGTVIKLPQALKIGVVAESMAAGEFKVEFDQFKLSQPKK